MDSRYTVITSKLAGGNPGGLWIGDATLNAVLMEV